MVGSFYLPLVLLAAVVGAGFALFAWRNRDQRGAKALAVFLLAASFWALAEGLAVAVGEFSSMVFWTRVALSLSVVLPAAWLGFTLVYSGTVQRLSHKLLAILAIEPVVFLVLVWTNDSHGTVWGDSAITGIGNGFNVVNIEFGVAFWGHQAYSYFLLVAGVVLLMRMVLQANQRVRWQGTVLLGAIFVPAVLTAVHIFGLIMPGLDPTPVGYILAGLIVAAVALEPELARVAPVTRDAGREAVLSELGDAILILDNSEHVVDYNPAAKQLLGAQQEHLGQQLPAVNAELARHLEELEEQGTMSLESNGKNRYYDIRISELSGSYGVLSGRVLSLRDVTERRQREQRLDVLNRLLRHNIRNELNVVRGKVELTEMNSDGDGEKTLEEAIERIDAIVARSDKVGRLSRLLEIDHTGALDIATELRGEYYQGTNPHPDAEITINLPDELYVSGGPSLVAAFDELVDNAVVHNDSATPSIRIAYDKSESNDEYAVITVEDNGPGIDQQEVETIVSGEETPLRHSSGIGLWLVHWLVVRVGGTLSFENTDDGCTVSIRLPRAIDS